MAESDFVYENFYFPFSGAGEGDDDFRTFNNYQPPIPTEKNIIILFKETKTKKKYPRVN